MGYLLILIKTLMSSGATALNKNYAQKTSHVPGGAMIYLLSVHVFASVFQLALAKGAVFLDKTTFLFAAVYGICCACSAFVGFIAFEKTTLVYRMVFTGAGAMMVPFLFELCWGESFGICEILSVVLRLCAVAVPLLFSREKFRNLPICLLLFFFGGAGTVVLKLLAQYSGASAGYSFCFWTNFLMLPFVAVLAVRKQGFVALKQNMTAIKPVLYLSVFAQTALNNIVALLSISILTMVSATTVSLMSSSLSLVLTTAMSVWLYKEKLTKQAVISLILSMLAILVGILQ